MNFLLIHSHKDSDRRPRRIILLFAGWGMDPGPFRSLHASGYDIGLLWDYREGDFCIDRLADYDEICVLAWSMGVVVASNVMPQLGRRLTGCVAVNGTLTPVDDRYGIPEKIFKGTLEGLTEESLARFDRRMCGSAASAAAFRMLKEQRPVEELAEELRRLGALSRGTGRFDVAVVSKNDMIFPAANQLAAWAKAGTKIIEADGPHLPDMQLLIDKFFIDKPLVASSFSSNISTYTSNATAQEQVARELVEGVLRSCSEPACALEVGCGAGMLTRMLQEAYPAAEWRLWDIAPTAPDGFGEIFRQCDAETAIAGESGERYDLIVSASTMQWFNSPRRFIEECWRVLRPGGVLGFSTFAHGNLPELTVVGIRGLVLPDVDELKSMLPQGFEIELFKSEDIKVEFPTPQAALRHLRLTGVNAVRQPGAVAATRRFIASGCRCLTYRPVIVVLKKTDR